MENKSKNNSKKKKIKSFNNKNHRLLFDASDHIITDVLGSYTGTPKNSAYNDDSVDLYPTQDVDDL